MAKKQDKQISKIKEDGSENPESKNPVSPNNTRPGPRGTSNSPRRTGPRSQGPRDSRTSENNNTSPNVGDNPGGRTNRANPVVRTPNFSTTNLSTQLVGTKFFNQSVVTQVFRFVHNETVVIRIYPRPIKERLRHQAEVWADKIIMTQELYLRSILSNSRSSDWREILISCYIYSYYLSLLYALTDRRVAEIPNDRVVIKGHGIMYQALLQPAFYFYHNDVTIKYDIDVSESDYNYILNQARSYSYISEWISTGTRFSLFNPQLDRCLKGLAAYSSSGDPEYGILSDSSGNSMYLSIDNFPISNSFYSTEGKVTKWYYAYVPNVDIMSNSTLFGKACFFTARNNEDVSRYFDLIDADDELSLVKYEVVSLAASMYPNPKPSK